MYQNHREIEMKWENKENTKPCEEDCNIPSFKLVFLESMTLCIVKICETFWAVNYDATADMDKTPDLSVIQNSPESEELIVNSSETNIGFKALYSKNFNLPSNFWSAISIKFWASNGPWTTSEG